MYARKIDCIIIGIFFFILQAFIAFLLNFCYFHHNRAPGRAVCLTKCILTAFPLHSHLGTSLKDSFSRVPCHNETPFESPSCNPRLHTMLSFHTFPLGTASFLGSSEELSNVFYVRKCSFTNKPPFSMSTFVVLG